MAAIDKLPAIEKEVKKLPTLSSSLNPKDLLQYIIDGEERVRDLDDFTTDETFLATEYYALVAAEYGLPAFFMPDGTIVDAETVDDDGYHLTFSSNKRLNDKEKEWLRQQNEIGLVPDYIADEEYFQDIMAEPSIKSQHQEEEEPEEEPEQNYDTEAEREKNRAVFEIIKPIGPNENDYQGVLVKGFKGIGVGEYYGLWDTYEPEDRVLRLCPKLNPKTTADELENYEIFNYYPTPRYQEFAYGKTGKFYLRSKRKVSDPAVEETREALIRLLGLIQINKVKSTKIDNEKYQDEDAYITQLFAQIDPEETNINSLFDIQPDMPKSIKDRLNIIKRGLLNKKRKTYNIDGKDISIDYRNANDYIELYKNLRLKLSGMDAPLKDNIEFKSVFGNLAFLLNEKRSAQVKEWENTLKEIEDAFKDAFKQNRISPRQMSYWDRTFNSGKYSEIKGRSKFAPELSGDRNSRYVYIDPKTALYITGVKRSDLYIDREKTTEEGYTVVTKRANGSMKRAFNANQIGYKGKDLDRMPYGKIKKYLEGLGLPDYDKSKPNTKFLQMPSPDSATQDLKTDGEEGAGIAGPTRPNNYGQGGGEGGNTLGSRHDPGHSYAPADYQGRPSLQGAGNTVSAPPVPQEIASTQAQSNTTASGLPQVTAQVPSIAIQKPEQAPSIDLPELPQVTAAAASQENPVPTVDVIYPAQQQELSVADMPEIPNPLQQQAQAQAAEQPTVAATATPRLNAEKPKPETPDRPPIEDTLSQSRLDVPPIDAEEEPSQVTIDEPAAAERPGMNYADMMQDLNFQPNAELLDTPTPSDDEESQTPILPSDPLANYNRSELPSVPEYELPVSIHQYDPLNIPKPDADETSEEPLEYRPRIRPGLSQAELELPPIELDPITGEQEIKVEEDNFPQIASASQVGYLAALAAAQALIAFKVNKGTTLQTVANKLGMNVKEVAALNSDYKPAEGGKIIVPEKFAKEAKIKNIITQELIDENKIQQLRKIANGEIELPGNDIETQKIKKQAKQLLLKLEKQKINSNIVAKAVGSDLTGFTQDSMTVLDRADSNAIDDIIQKSHGSSKVKPTTGSSKVIDFNRALSNARGVDSGVKNELRRMKPADILKFDKAIKKPTTKKGIEEFVKLLAKQLKVPATKLIGKLAPRMVAGAAGGLIGGPWGAVIGGAVAIASALMVDELNKGEDLELRNRDADDVSRIIEDPNKTVAEKRAALESLGGGWQWENLDEDPAMPIVQYSGEQPTIATGESITSLNLLDLLHGPYAKKDVDAIIDQAETYLSQLKSALNMPRANRRGWKKDFMKEEIPKVKDAIAKLKKWNDKYIPESRLEAYKKYYNTRINLQDNKKEDDEGRPSTITISGKTIDKLNAAVESGNNEDIIQIIDQRVNEILSQVKDATASLLQVKIPWEKGVELYKETKNALLDMVAKFVEEHRDKDVSDIVQIRFDRESKQLQARLMALAPYATEKSAPSFKAQIAGIQNNLMDPKDPSKFDKKNGIAYIDLLATKYNIPVNALQTLYKIESSQGQFLQGDYDAGAAKSVGGLQVWKGGAFADYKQLINNDISWNDFRTDHALSTEVGAWYYDRMLKAVKNWSKKFKWKLTNKIEIYDKDGEYFTTLKTGGIAPELVLAAMMYNGGPSTVDDETGKVYLKQTAAEARAAKNVGVYRYAQKFINKYSTPINEGNKKILLKQKIFEARVKLRSLKNVKRS